MTSMMSMKSMTSMKYMKWLVYIHTYIWCEYYAIVCFFIHRIIMISNYPSTDG